MARFRVVILPNDCSIGYNDTIQDITRRERAIQDLLDNEFKGYILIPKNENGYSRYGKESQGCERVNITVRNLKLSNLDCRTSVVARLYKPLN